MSEDILSVMIDTEGRLHIEPAKTSFAYIYREAMEVSWNPSLYTLHSQKPRKWNYGQWFSHILAAAREQGRSLRLTEKTKWTNVTPEIEAELWEAFQSESAA